MSLVRWTVHAGDAVLHRLEAFVLRAATRITCLSSFMLGEVARAHPWLQHSIREKALVIRGGTSLREFATGITQAEARAVLGWDINVRTIVAVRRLEPRMGLDLLLDACNELKRVLAPGFRCVIAGRGSQEAALKQRCKALDLDGCVEFAGFAPPGRLPYFYAAADAVVMPSLAAEGFGVTSIEALASGTPVVATPIGANAEVTGSVDLRFVAGDTTVPALVKAIVDTLDRGWDREDLSQACLRRFDIDVTGPEYERILRGASATNARMAAGA
jgi:glycosyltransferase involved in cell wall biosynthesis